MKVYFDKGLIQKEYISFLAPLLGCPDFSIWREDDNQIKDWYAVGKHLLSFSPKEDCDYFVYPKYFSLEYFHELKEYATIAKSLKKKVLVFYYGEIDDYINISDNIIWYKRSTKLTNPNNEYCLPPFPADMLPEHDNQIPFVHEAPDHKYSIGYTGYANYSDLPSLLRYIFVRLIGLIFRTKICKYILRTIKNETLYATLVNAGIGNYCRGATTKVLKQSKRYLFEFIQRVHALTVQDKTLVRKQYINNMAHADFALLVRGFGNYSVRQYEALSLGKIPVYIDTGAKFPFPEHIPYKDLFIIVPFSDIHRIESYIDTYVAKNTGRFQSIQKQIRAIYEDYFIMKSYYSKIITELSNK